MPAHIVDTMSVCLSGGASPAMDDARKALLDKGGR